MDEATSVALPPSPAASSSAVHEKLNKSPGKIGMAIFGLVLIGGLGYAVSQLANDLGTTHLASAWPYVLLGMALLIALGFEFVNGFHDTANAVATVIYTHSLEPHIAVVWSGMWNLIGVLHFLGRGRLRDPLAASGRVDSAGRQRRRLRDGLRAADGGDHLEPQHLVVRTTRLELAYADRLDHRSRHRQSADESQDRHERRRLGAGS